MGVVAVSTEYFSPSYGTYTSNSASSTAAATSAANAYQQVLASQELENIVNIGSSGSGSGLSIDNSLSSADLLDLSPAALSILNGIESASSGAGLAETTNTLSLTGAITPNGVTGTAAGTSSASGSAGGLSLTLTPAQQTQVAAIVAEFATAPVTPQTFTQIQNALTAAGINPEQVSLQQLLTAYEYAYTPGLSFNEQLFTDTLADELTPA